MNTSFIRIVAVVCVAMLSILNVNNALAGNYTWTGSANKDWNNSANWSPSGTPSTSDTVTIGTGSDTIQIGANTTINRLVMSGRTLHLNGNELQISQRASLNGGKIYNGTLKMRGTYAFFQGTNTNCTIDCIVNQIKLSGGTFDGKGSFEHNGSANGWGEGGCVFNDSIKIKSSGTSYLRLGQETGDTFNGVVEFISTGTYPLQVAYHDSTYFKKPVRINSTSGGISFCNDTTMQVAVFQEEAVLLVGSTGITGGTITLKNIYHENTNAVNLIASGSTLITVVSSTFNDKLAITSPGVLSKNSIYNDSTSFTRIANNTTAYQWDGGNTFNGVFTLTSTNTSTGVVRMANKTGDKYNADAYFNTTSTAGMEIAYSDTSEFKRNIFINHSKVVFNKSKGMVRLTGSDNQVLQGNATFLIGKLKLNKDGGSINLNRSMTIDSSITFINGIINTDSTITLKAAVNCSGASNLSFVDGPVKKIGNTAFVFPVGDEGNYYPLGITAPGLSTDAYTCSYKYSYHNESDSTDTLLSFIAKCAYWELGRMNGTSDVKVTLYWDSLGCSIYDTSGVTIANWDGTRWRNLGSEGIVGDLSSGCINSELNVVSFKKFAWAFNTSITPITVTEGTSRIMPDDFFGYNGNNTIESDINGSPLQSWSLLSSSGLLNGNSISIMRLPAGTLSNYADWRTGYPIIERDLPFDWFYDKNSYRLPMNRTGNEFAHVKDNLEKTAARPIIAWNMLTSTYEFELASIYRLQEVNLPVRYLELGNEFYLNDEFYIEKFPSVTDYVQMAIQWASDFRILGLPQTEDIRIAVVGAKSNENSTGRRRLWLDQVLNRLGKNDHIDAVTIHDYIFEGSAQGNCTGGISNQNLQKFFSLAFSNGDMLMGEEFEKVQNFNVENPSDQLEIWITEYNLDDDNDKRTGTWAHGLLNAAMTLKYLETPEVTKAISHTMISDAKFGNIFESATAFENVRCHGLPDDDLQGVVITTEEGEFSAIGTSLNMIGRAMRNSVNASPLIFSSTGTLYNTNYKDFYGWSFADTQGDLRFIVLNLSTKAKEFDFSSIIATISPSTYSAIVVEALNFDYAIVGNPVTSLTNPPLDKLFQNNNPWTPQGLTIRMEPFSMLLLEPNDMNNPWHHARLTDDVICTGTTTTLVIESNDLSIINPICSSCTSGEITISAPAITGNRAVYTVTANQGSSTPYNILPCPTCTNTAQSLTVHDNLSNLTIASSAPHTINNDEINFCPSDVPIELTASFTSGDGGFTTSTSFLWAPAIDSGLVSSTCSGNTPMCSTITVTPLRSTIYTVYVNDGQCWESKSVSIKVPVTPFDLGDDITVCEGTEVEITAKYVDIDPITDPIFSGTNGATLPILTITPAVGIHTIPISVTDDGCFFEEEINLEVISCCTSSIAPANHLGQYYSHGEDIGIAFTATCTTPACSLITIPVSGSSNTGSLELIGDPANRPTIRIDGELRITNDVRDPDFNNALVVDGLDLTIKNCNLEFGQDAWVNIMYNRLLVLENCTLTTCGTNMWRGMVLDKKGERNPPEVILKNCYIENAQTALYLTREAIYTVENCTFYNNYIDIQIENYLQGISNGMQSTGQFSVTGCTFTSDGNMLMPPFDSDYKLTAFDLKNVERMRIGDITSASNILENATFGIRMENSGAEIWNNTFNGLQVFPGSLHNNWDGSAIFLFNDYTFSGRTLRVGADATASSNVFTNCVNGIFGSGDCNYILHNNRFGENNNTTDNRIGISNIYIANIRMNTVDIDFHNQFYDYSIGIEIEGMTTASSVSIKNNDFFDSFITDGLNFDGTAILLNSHIPIPLIQTGLIQSNQIGSSSQAYFQPRIGIHVGNVGGFKIQENAIYFHEDDTPDFNFRGIRLENAPECEVSGNVVTNASYNSGAGNSLLGIRVDASSLPHIKCNNVANMGQAMQFVNNNDYVSLISNNFNDYDLGVQLGDGSFPTFIGNSHAAPGIGLDNFWFNDASNRVEGLLNLPTFMPWYHHGSELFSNVGAPVRADNSWSNAISPEGFQTGYLDQACDEIGPTATLRSLSFADIAADTARYIGSFSNEYLYLRKESAYQFMMADTGRITMDREDDEDFENLFSTLSFSNIGKLDSVIQHCSQQEWALANTLFESVVDTNNHEHYLKLVLEIIIEAALEEHAFDSGDTNTLLEIANYHSLEGGRATKLARAALHLEIEDVGGGSRISHITEKVTQPELKLWPNPTDDYININKSETFSYQIYDAGMRLITSGYTTGGIINVSKLMAGYYLLFVNETGLSFKPLGFCKIK
jgi:hypothetical protein